jgi:hypothetical protein
VLLAVPYDGSQALTSAAWAEDFNGVQALGSVNSANRTPAQTHIALFWHRAGGPTLLWNAVARNQAQDPDDIADRPAAGGRVGAAPDKCSTGDGGAAAAAAEIAATLGVSRPSIRSRDPSTLCQPDNRPTADNRYAEPTLRDLVIACLPAPETLEILCTRASRPAVGFRLSGADPQDQ